MLLNLILFFPKWIWEIPFLCFFWNISNTKNKKAKKKTIAYTFKDIL